MSTMYFRLPKFHFLKKDCISSITYEDKSAIEHKTEYVKSMGLGGIVFWEYTLDKTGLLLNTLYNGLNI